MTLSCILDTCPITGKAVDMRTCCGTYGRKPCRSYGAEPWSECGEVTCRHPQASPENPTVQDVRREAFRQTAGAVGHILYV